VMARIAGHARDRRMAEASETASFVTGSAPGRPALLMVGHFLSSSVGTRSVCEDLADRLSAAGWPVWTTSTHLGRLRRLSDMMLTAWRRRRQYAVVQVDVYSGPAFVWAEMTCRVLRLAHKPYVLTLHGGNLPNFARREPRRVQRLLGSAAAVTTPSRYLLEQMRPYSARLHLLPNALQIDNYEFRPRQHPRPHLVWLRAFHSIYQPELAVEVVSRLVGGFPEIALTMAGPDKRDGSRSRTEALAEQLGIGSRVALPGRVPKAEVPACLNRGDVFLNTTTVDNAPVSVLEAMACGLCVVSTNVGGIPYLLEDQRDALLVPAGDAEAMAAAVRRLLTEPGLAERLSRGARDKAEQFAWSVVLPQWEELLMGIAA
jgi:glycosyltransferase involved in cell wall biosynthesis